MPIQSPLILVAAAAAAIIVTSKKSKPAKKSASSKKPQKNEREIDAPEIDVPYLDSDPGINPNPDMGDGTESEELESGLMLGAEESLSTTSDAGGGPNEDISDGVGGDVVEEIDPTLGSSVSRGIRNDRRGQFYWHVYHAEDGKYLAQLMRGSSRFDPIIEDVGGAATENGAKLLLRKILNDRLIQRYPDKEWRNDPYVPPGSKMRERRASRRISD